MRKMGKNNCVFRIQQYVWYKRGLPVWAVEGHPFPMDVDNAISDSLEVLRPKLQVLGSLEEANKEVEQLERDTLKKISELCLIGHLLSVLWIT